MILIFQIRRTSAEEQALTKYVIPNELYRRAEDAFIVPPFDLMEKLSLIITNGWQYEERLIDSLEANRISLDILCEAAKQSSDGKFFYKTPEKVTIAMPTSNYYKTVLLHRYLLLQGMLFENKNEYKKAENSYIAMTRFLLHMAQDDFKTLTSQLMEAVCLDTGYPVLLRSLNNKNFSIGYYKKLQNTLLDIQKNNDFLKRAFITETEICKSFIDLLEEKQNISIFKIDEEKDRPKTLMKKFLGLVLFDKYFYDAMRKEFNRKIDGLRRLLIEAAEKNKPEIYAKGMNVIVNNPRNKTDKPAALRRGISTFIVYSMFNLSQKKVLLAKQIANKLLRLPCYENTIVRWHLNHSKLNLMILASVLRIYQLDNGQLPADLDILVPEYLSKIPQDSYNNFMPLSYRYDGQKGYVYSFGVDRDDDRGVNKIDIGEVIRNKDFDADGDIVIVLDNEQGVTSKIENN